MKKLLGLFLGLILTLTSFGQYINTSDTVVVTFNGSNGASVNQTFTDTTKFGSMNVSYADLDTNSTVFMIPGSFITADSSLYSTGGNNGFNVLNSANIMAVLDSSITKFDINIGSIDTDLDSINITLSNLKLNDNSMAFYTQSGNNLYNVLMVKDTTNLTNIDSNGDLSDTLFIINPDTLQASLSIYNANNTWYNNISIGIPNPDTTVGDHSIILMVEPILNYRYGLIRINYTVSSGSLGLNENTVKSEFKVYPNPVSDVLNVKTGVSGVNTLKYIYSLTGELIMSFRDSVDVSELPDGIYILTDGVNTCKFVKK